MKIIKNLTIVLLAIITLSSCSNDTPEEIHEEEVITTVNITLTNGNDTITLQSLDSDGDGTVDETNISENLKANTTYIGSIELLNETEDPAEDITTEVEEEGSEHQFFYVVTNSIANFDYTDSDENGDPIGIDFTLTTNDAGTGKFTLILKHEPIKDADGVSSGDSTNAGGSTDVDVSFNLTVE
ncbi:MAG: type 1 periplasmic binding fold superfamily protein [Polaribacter sp.]|uniref:type 1 periplasmic binding fold superfamily protein n=1 Tax=Polaribacter sp. TaxID=1920175 RepID=UPI0032640806